MAARAVGTTRRLMVTARAVAATTLRGRGAGVGMPAVAVPTCSLPPDAWWSPPLESVRMSAAPGVLGAAVLSGAAVLAAADP